LSGSFDDYFSRGIRARFSDRDVDFSFPSDIDGGGVFTDQQKNFLQSQWMVDAEQCVTVRQVHGSEILRVDGPLDHVPEADGIITNQFNVSLIIRTADCLPIFMVAPEKKVIGLVHAGWRGSRDGIVIRAVEAMRDFGVSPRDIRVAFGPSISPVFYEVGREFISIFPNEIDAHGLTCSLDLALVNLRQLESAGVPVENIYDCGICTFANERYHSFRRDGVSSGRMASCLMMESSLMEGGENE
jgi:polyphenol oxidase